MELDSSNTPIGAVQQIADFYGDHLLGINFVSFPNSTKRFANAVVYIPNDWIKTYDENRFRIVPITGAEEMYDLCVVNPNLVEEADDILVCLKNIVELNRAIETRKKAIQELYQKQQMEIAQEIESLVNNYQLPSKGNESTVGNADEKTIPVQPEKDVSDNPE